MAGENCLTDQVKTLQRHIGLFGKAFKDLTERVKALEEKAKSDDRKEIMEIIETQRIIDEILVANSDAIKKINSEMVYIQNNHTVEKEKELTTQNGVKKGRIKRCRYFNKGHCKYREKCKFYHPKTICKNYLESGKCESTDCSDRHPKLCRFWSKNKAGCRRGSDCDFLHVTLAQHDGKVTVESKVEETEFKCASCKDAWTDKNCVVEHKLNNHVMYLCLNCDDWIQDKTKVLDQNFTLLDERGNLRRDL